MTVSNHLQHNGSWTRAIVVAAVSGVFYGAVMGPLAVRQRRKVSALGKLPARDLRIARRAMNHGPVPRDPDIRQAALKLATLQLKESARSRWLGLILCAALGVFGMSLALTESP